MNSSGYVLLSDAEQKVEIGSDRVENSLTQNCYQASYWVPKYSEVFWRLLKSHVVHRDIELELLPLLAR